MLQSSRCLNVHPYASGLDGLRVLQVALFLLSHPTSIFLAKASQRLHVRGRCRAVAEAPARQQPDRRYTITAKTVNAEQIFVWKVVKIMTFSSLNVSAGNRRLKQASPRNNAIPTCCNRTAII